MMYRRTCLVFLSLLLLTVACKQKKNKAPEPATQESDVIPLPEAEVNLFDGTTLGGWHLYNNSDAEIKNWVVLDSALVCLGIRNNANSDLATDREFEDFELSFEWKIGEGGYSGLAYHVLEDPKYKTPAETGPQFQIIDDLGFPERLEANQKAGSDLYMYSANSLKKLMPVGQWNRSKILFQKGHVEYWLNGQKVVSFEAWSDDWKNRKAASKWNEMPAYGMSKKGKIVLMNQGTRVYFRHMIITE